MHPIIFKLGDFQVTSWLLARIIGVVAMLAFSVWRAPRFGIARERIPEIGVFFLIATIIGSRLWYVALHLREFQGNLLNAVNPYHGGFRGVGGIVLGLLVVWLYARKHQLSLLALFDVGAPGYLLHAAIGRIGCFLNACCFGLPTDSILGVVFPPEHHPLPFPAGTPLWPTQLFSFVLNVLAVALVLWGERRRPFPGAAFSLATFGYVFERIFVDQFRYYPPSQILGQVGFFRINFNHPVLWGLAILGAVIWVRGLRRLARDAQQAVHG